jgi:hypothetical protein
MGVKKGSFSGFYRRARPTRILAGWLSARGAQAVRTLAEHEGSATLPEVLPHASPDQLPPHDWHLDYGAPIG